MRLSALLLASLSLGFLPLAAQSPVPTPQQLAWQRMELTMFCHFGVNTFTNREWGDGTEDEKIFNPTALDCRQWARSAKAGGFKLMILTAKHHDGFCLWPSKFTDHSVRKSPWKNGQGDVVKEFVTACRAENLKVGLYLSPWDRHEKSYGTDAYNDYFCNQLTELLSNYGPIDEVWFDGACGEGPNGKKQVYDWKRIYPLIRKLQPQALIAIMGPDIRWVGNESGVAREGESSVITRDGQPAWHPAECDVSIRPGWFYHADQDAKVKGLDQLADIYFKSVGRNSVLLLNVPPDQRGLFADADVKRLEEFGAAVRGFQGNAVASGLGTQVVEFGGVKSFNLANLQEDISKGEQVKSYRLEVRNGGQWDVAATGRVLGQRNLHRLPEIQGDAARLVVESSGNPTVKWSLHHASPIGPWSKGGGGSLTAGKPATASNVHGNSTEFGGDKAVDGDKETRWATSDETRECWLEVDLLKEREFGKVGISELEPRITKFRIETRDQPDGEWKPVFTGDRAGQDFHASFGPVKARYVRLHILEASFAPTIWEFELSEK